MLEAIWSKVDASSGWQSELGRALAKKVKSTDPQVDLKDKNNKKKQSGKKFKDRSEENDLVSQLERLASLKERGLLTNKEFVEAKRRLLI